MCPPVRLLLACLAALAFPVAALADTTITSRDVPLHGERTLAGSGRISRNSSCSANPSIAHARPRVHVLNGE